MYILYTYPATKLTSLGCWQNPGIHTMAAIQEFPHCRPLYTKDVEFKGTFQSRDNAFEFARAHEYNVVVFDKNTYYMGRIVKVNVKGSIQYALGSANGRDCDCMHTKDSTHHQSIQARNLCVSQYPLLDEVDSRFLPVTAEERDYDSTAWRIDSYSMRTV